MSFEEILRLSKIANSYAIHYTKDGCAVASLYKDITDLTIKAYLGDDKNITKFQFRHDGPVAIVYRLPVKISNPMPMDSFPGVIAVTFADVSLLDELSPKIFPCEIGQYDVGSPYRFDVARQLLCHYTGAEWDEEFLPKKYQEVGDASLEYFSTASGWTA